MRNSTNNQEKKTRPWPPGPCLYLGDANRRSAQFIPDPSEEYKGPETINSVQWGILPFSWLLMEHMMCQILDMKLLQIFWVSRQCWCDIFYPDWLHRISPPVGTLPCDCDYSITGVRRLIVTIGFAWMQLGLNRLGSRKKEGQDRLPDSDPALLNGRGHDSAQLK